MTRTALLLGLSLALVPLEVLPQADQPLTRAPKQEAARAASLLVRLEGFSLKTADFREASVIGYRLQPLFSPEPYRAKGTERPVMWLIATPREPRFLSRAGRWDAAHEFLQASRESPALRSAQAIYVEPNEKNVMYPKGPPAAPCDLSKTLAPPGVQFCVDQDKNWDAGNSFAWHLGSEYSQLRDARMQKATSCAPYITILDTGIRASHHTTPRKLDRRGKNFVEGGDNVEDPGPFLAGKNSGHGPATIAILAGKHVRMVTTDPYYVFDEDLGGAPDATIIPVRIADSVVHFYTDEMASGIDYAGRLAKADGKNACHVVSISMGGIASRAWADRVNFTYEHGVTIVAAAGNNFGGFPTRYTVYPSRFARVVTATGATAKHMPYEHKNVTEMAGNWGPPSVMEKALGAYTPNTPWVDYLHDDVVNLNGAGTSSATPQIAAAVALWLRKYGGKYPPNWERVAAVRNALFAAAEKKLPTPQINRERFGQGLLRAADALAINPGVKPGDESPPAEVWFPFWRILLGLDEPKTTSSKIEDGEIRMLEVESLNLTIHSMDLGHLTGDVVDKLPSAGSDDGKRLIAYLCTDKRASNRLKKFLQARKGCP